MPGPGTPATSTAPGRLRPRPRSFSIQSAAELEDLRLPSHEHGWPLTGRIVYRLDAFLSISIWDDDGGIDGTDLMMPPNWGSDDDVDDWTFVDLGDWDGRFPGDPVPVKS